MSAKNFTASDVAVFSRSAREGSRELVYDYVISVNGVTVYEETHQIVDNQTKQRVANNANKAQK